MSSQSYGNPPARNVFSAAGKPAPGAQGAGVIPGKTSVPVPGTDTTQPAYKGGMKQKPAGFDSGIINGKI